MVDDGCTICGKRYPLPELVDEDWAKKLAKIKGVGAKTIKDIERIYKREEFLKTALTQDNVPLRDDIVLKLKQYYNI